ncbi:MAG: LLM class F420-dependent oxidoreductase [Chloroflexi bacterium]|nr:LLM class F420-dependent oxidoreductase [Chloroflexota bacterium]
MDFGVVFPQIEFPSDPVAIRDYAQAVEGMGFTYLVAYDHVLGANPDRPGGWHGAYTYKNSFQEIFVFFSYLAGITQKLGFLTGIIILPQRQTALVAKQAATLDVYCGGRLRLGVGLGWNQVEYEALGQDFHNRGRRIEEQIEVLRLLFTQDLVTYQGKYHSISDAGLNPMPIQRPIPIWFGGSADAALERAARIGDGWLPNTPSFEETRPALEKMQQYLEKAGRTRSEFGLDVRLVYGEGKPDVWMSEIKQWQEAGAARASINTIGRGFSTPSAHLNALQTFAQAVGLKPS